jgi:signal recognition particle subunit SRP19
MYDAITRGLSLNARLEMNKAYSRDWLTRGRVHVELKSGTGAPCNKDIPSKLVLLVKCAELCARHSSRQERLKRHALYEQQLFSGGGMQPKTKGAAASSKGSAATAASAKQVKAAGKKKGKKR